MEDLLNYRVLKVEKWNLMFPKITKDAKHFPHLQPPHRYW